jgi:hypothetical protein
MTDTMRDRVARAIYMSWDASGTADLNWDEIKQAAKPGEGSKPNQSYLFAMRQADAAIEAMREPTDRMLDAGQPQVNLSLEPGEFEFLAIDEVERIFTAMIDAAISEGKE